MVGLVKIPLEPGSLPEPGKISEMIMEFAQPLMEWDQGGPPDIQAVRNVMMMAMVCWNVPIVRDKANTEAANAQRMFDTAMSQMPEPLKSVLLAMTEDRKTRFGAVPFSVIVHVEGTSLDDLSIVAEARMPGVPAVKN